MEVVGQQCEMSSAESAARRWAPPRLRPSHCGDGFDLQQEIGIGEAAQDAERAGGRRAGEIGLQDVRDRDGLRKADDTSEQRLDKLEAVLAMGGSRVQAVAPLFAALLSIPFGERYPPLTLSPLQQRRRMLAALLDQFGAEHRPKAGTSGSHWRY